MIRIFYKFFFLFKDFFNKLTYFLFSSIMCIGDRMNKKIRFIFLVFLLVYCFFIGDNYVEAKTLRQLYNELSTLEKNYNAAKSRVSMSQAELRNIKASIASAEAEIKSSQQQIIQAENDIQKSEAEIDKKKEETNQMLLYLQIMNSHGDSLLEYVMDADNYTDFIYRYAVVTQMSDYNQGLMDELKTLIDQLNSKKAALVKRQEELEKKKSDLQAKYLIVQVQSKNSEQEGLSVATQISEKKKLINSYKSLGCTMDQDVNSCSAMAAVNGWTYPLKRFYQTSAYAESRGSVKHYAVDLGVSEGTNVYAVANGIVLAAAASNCGGMVVQIKHNYNGSYYVSLYMHLIDSYVRVGNKVTGGQVIGTSGGGPREVSKWGDHCTQGAHLHFAMASGEGMIRYSSELGSTFNPVRFFPAMKGIGSKL